MKNFKKIITTTIVIINVYLGLRAQTYSGVVFDESGNPAIGASVYFDGTTNGTTTNAEGFFTLKINKLINSSLIIRHIGYETVVIAEPSNEKRYTINLKLKPTTIKEVLIMPDRFTREQKMKAFKREFLGKNRAGQSCVIENEDDIELFYDYANRKLVASAEKPLRIQNKYLGYWVEFNLFDFYVQYSINSLNIENIHKSLFLGTTRYIDVPVVSPTHIKRRKSSFFGSSQHFFKSIANQKLNDEKFSLYSNSWPVAPNQAFEVKDSLNLKNITLLPDPEVAELAHSSGMRVVIKSRSFNILYRRIYQSVIRFDELNIFVDAYGNTSCPGAISFGGRMGRNRFGNLLPLNYEPTEN